jgi:hypothetical protein
MMGTYTAKEAQAFVEKNIAKAKRPPTIDAKLRRARAAAGRKDTELARKVLSTGGLDLKRLDKLARDGDKARRSRAKEQHRLAIKNSAAVAKWLSGQVLPVVPADPMNIIIDRVTFIRTFADQGVITDSNIGSLDSWAKYKYQPSSSDAFLETGSGKLSFFVLWQNPRSDTIVANVGPRVQVNANLSVSADWNGVASWYLPDSRAIATVRSRTTVFAMDSSINSIVSDVILGNDSVSGGFFGGDDSTSLVVDQFMPGAGVFVPANAFILIEVSLVTEWQLLDGSVTLDAASGDFKVTVPHLIITVT